MRTIPAKGPDGTEWAVRVVWQPRWPLLVRRFGGWRAKRRARKISGRDVADTVDGIASPGGSFDVGDDIFVGILFVVGLIVFGALFWFLLLPLLLVFVDLAVILLLLLLAIPARVLLRRPWTVEAVTTKVRRDQREQRFVAAVVGWRAALRKRDEIAQSLSSGQSPTSIPALTPAEVDVD